MVNGIKLFEKRAFSILVRENRELAEVRRQYAAMSAQERREAADWQYQSAMANDLFNQSLARMGKIGFGDADWPPGVLALAIDPLFAPAILTVGSLEYQMGRKEEAMELFRQLPDLSKEEEDLTEILDKTGNFLIDQGDIENALAFYSAAEKTYPTEPLFPLGVGYCLGKLGRFRESVEKHRQVDDLEPDHYEHLNDLGYTLMEAGEYGEAEAVLQRAISLAPSDYKFPQNNLKELKRRKAAM